MDKTALSPSARHPRLEKPGLAQLSLVEHSLCPLDASHSMHDSAVHETSYQFTDAHGKRRTAQVRITYPNGLSPNDELYLWGLLGLTFAQADPGLNFSATPHYCLRQLGFIDEPPYRGGKDYKWFRAALWRLAGVTYFNTACFDPMRGEHRDRSFGFLKYDLPLDAQSSRAWRIVWDPLFFEHCEATGGRLFFDLPTYRELDCASRRLFLFLHKLFWRKEISPELDVTSLAQNVLGFSAHVAVWDLKSKLYRCLQKLLDREIIALPDNCSRVQQLFHKRKKGSYSLRLLRGRHFERAHHPSTVPDASDSPVYDQLECIGFEAGAIRRLLQKFPANLLSEWADITLAAKEKHGEEFFKKSPQAYFTDNVSHAAQGKRTPPDWWRELRRQEERYRSKPDSPSQSADDRACLSEQAYRRYLASEARGAFENVMDQIFKDLATKGVPEADARDRARYIATMNLRSRFHRDHPEYS